MNHVWLFHHQNRYICINNINSITKINLESLYFYFDYVSRLTLVIPSDNNQCIMNTKQLRGGKGLVHIDPTTNLLIVALELYFLNEKHSGLTPLR